MHRTYREALADPASDRMLVDAIHARDEAIGLFADWARSLPPAYRASLVNLCKDNKAASCFCGCHSTVRIAPDA